MLKPRMILEKVTEYLTQNRIIVITGMRQVGKTSLIRLILEQSLDVPSFYFDLEDLQIQAICNRGYDHFVNYLKLMGADLSLSPIVAIDEIQYLKNPSNFLKLLHDHYPDIRLIVSGSSSLDIKTKFKDSLAGRKIVFELDPLSFEEFILFKDEKAVAIKKNIGTIMDVLNNSAPEGVDLVKHQFSGYLYEYLTFGGYPGVTLAENQDFKKSLLKDIHTSYIRKDIKDIATIEDIYGFNNLIGLLATQIGNLVNINELSLRVGLSVNTIKKYLFLLENTFIISLLRPYYTNRRKELVKMPKVYFNDVGLRNTVIGNYSILNQSDEGAVMENFVFSELKKRFTTNESLFFWRTTTGAEVDFVVKHEGGAIIPIEVKAADMKKASISRSLRSFIEIFKPNLAVVVNKSLSCKDYVNDTKVVFIPAYAL